MSDVPGHEVDSPAVRSPWWWNFFFSPLIPVGSPSETAPPGRGPIVVPAPGTTPEFGPDYPEPGLEPDPYDDEELYQGPTESTISAMRTSLFASVSLIVLLFFFAIASAPGW